MPETKFSIKGKEFSVPERRVPGQYERSGPQDKNALEGQNKQEILRRKSGKDGLGKVLSCLLVCHTARLVSCQLNIISSLVFSEC